MKKLVFSIVALMMLTSFAYAGEERTKIDARIAEFTAAWNSGDFEGVLAIYDKDFYAFAPPAKPVRDREAFKKLLAAEVVDYTNMKIETTSLKIHGGYAYQLGTGSYNYKDGAGKDVRDKSDLLNIWKKDDKGDWNLHLEVWWSSDSDAANDRKVRAKLDARTAELVTAWNSGDYKTVLAMHGKDCLVVPEGAEPTGDRDALGKQLASDVKDYPNVNYKTTTLKAHGKYAYEIGVDTYTIKGKQGEEATGKDDYLVVWKKDDKGVWNIHLDFWWGSKSDE